MFFFFTLIEITIDDDDEEDMRTSELRITRQTYKYMRLDKTCKGYQCCTFFFIGRAVNDETQCIDIFMNSIDD